MSPCLSMQHRVQEYLKERRSAGFALEIPGKLLMGFAAFQIGEIIAVPLLNSLSWIGFRAAQNWPRRSLGHADCRQSGRSHGSALAWTRRRLFPRRTSSAGRAGG